MRGVDSKAAEGRRSPRRWRLGQDPRERAGSWSTPALWRFEPSAVCKYVRRSPTYGLLTILYVKKL
jgi:hypothetical protein